MSDETLDVLIAVYLIPDLAQQDFDALVQLVEDKTVASDGVVLVNKDAEGEVHVMETGDHAGRKGVKVGVGVGLVVGCSRRRCSPRRRSAAPPATSSASSPRSGSRAGSATRWTSRCHPGRPV
jgi:hypothetical protein